MLCDLDILIARIKKENKMLLRQKKLASTIRSIVKYKGNARGVLEDRL